MPKRRNFEKIELYKSKIRRLQEKEQKIQNRRRRVVIYSDSSQSENESDNENRSEMADADVVPCEDLVEPDAAEAHPPEDDAEEPKIDEQERAMPSPPTPPVEAAPPPPGEDTLPELDEEFLCALGDTIDEVPTYGENIHPDLARRWQPILRSGMARDCKEKLLKEYSIPENCKLLRAPSLNPQLSRPLTEATKGRDRKLEASQQQLGLGISAINKAVTILLTGDDKQSKIQAIKVLSDGVRLLSDLHFMKTQTRIKLITPSLDKTFLDMVQNVERDELLFGSKLADKIKDSVAVEKQGWQIKKGASFQKNATYTNAPSTSQHTTPRPRYQGNWTGPPRYHQPLPASNRGGRGAGPRNPQHSGSRRAAPPGPPQTRSSSHKHRATTRY